MLLQHHLRPVARVPVDCVEEVLATIDRFVTTYQPRPQPQPPLRSHNHLALALHRRHLTPLQPGEQSTFRVLWGHNIPVIVEGVQHMLQGGWNPATFCRTHSNEIIDVIDSRYSGKQKRTVACFFDELLQDPSVRAGDIKSKDLPTSSSFEASFPQLYADFMSAVPMPSYSRSDGFRNLAAHYAIPPHPHRSNKPDLGPKLYLASRDVGERGTTLLHKDVCSAVNILTFSSNSDQGAPGARWLIFRPEDSASLSDYLRTKLQLPEDVHPIHSQQCFVTDAMLPDLDKRGVRPYVIEQHVGDAIFIPAGAAHQVSNMASCIKVACDFLCAEGLDASMEVAADFRRIKQEDLLQINAMLWHSWRSLVCLADRASTNTPNQALTGKKKKRWNSRHNVRGQDDLAARKRARRDQEHPSTTFLTRQYHCPHPSCMGAERRYQDAVAVINHLCVSVFVVSIKLMLMIFR
ncbi:hypothetical protein C8Q76DRAFT_626499 [Earliella scabrosa]|nr:hypothetical protein C8Q76DRAFT_626499 [Earliella scabrosa]